MRRREFLVLAGAALVPSVVLGSAIADRTLYLSARDDGNGRCFFSGFDADGRMHFDLPLPGRGHAASVHPAGREAVLIARRPGRFMVAVDLANGQVSARAHARPDRHFCGHGVYSSDGELFYTTENDFEKGRGVIGVREVAAGYRWIAELPSHGIGPHELLLSRGGEALVVANGGILTHPDSGRKKLNLDTMSSSLAYLDARTGDLLDEQRLPAELHQLSIRHLALLADDSVCLVMQYQGPRSHDQPLVGLHRSGQAFRLLRAPADIQRRMSNYCGSVSTDPTGRWLAVSSPRGNLVTFWSVAGHFAGSVRLPDVCGLAEGGVSGAFLMSGGGGDRMHFRIGEKRGRFVAVSGPVGARWDNHLTTMVAPPISNKVSREHEYLSLSGKERVCFGRSACSLEPRG